MSFIRYIFFCYWFCFTVNQIMFIAKDHYMVTMFKMPK